MGSKMSSEKALKEGGFFEIKIPDTPETKAKLDGIYKEYRQKAAKIREEERKKQIEVWKRLRRDHPFFFVSA